jgi:hypothetical protein
MSAQNAFMTQYATSSQVYLPTHKYTLCCPSALYMHPAHIVVSLQCGGSRNMKYTEAMECGLEK